MEDKTDIFGEFGIWVWGKSIPSDVDKCQEFMRMSPLGKYIEKLEKENKELQGEYIKLKSIKNNYKKCLKQAQPNALKASEVKPKPLSEQISKRKCGHYVREVLSFCPVCDEISKLRLSSKKLENIICNTLKKMNERYRKFAGNPLIRKIDFILLPSERIEVAEAIYNASNAQSEEN